MKVKKELDLLWKRINLLEKQINCEHQFVLSCTYTKNIEKTKMGSFVCIKCNATKEKAMTQKEINAVKVLGY